jgi:hypothetical protein
MREISRSVQIDKQAKKMCNCTVRTVYTDADMAGSYDTWQVLVGSRVDKLVYDTWQWWRMEC